MNKPCEKCGKKPRLMYERTCFDCLDFNMPLDFERLKIAYDNSIAHRAQINQRRRERYHARVAA